MKRYLKKVSLNLIICLLFLISCGTMKSYKKPVFEPLNYLFSYEISKSPSTEQINFPILVTSADFISKNINLNYKHNSQEVYIMNNYSIAQLFADRYKEDIKYPKQIKEINQKLSSSLENDLITLLKYNGISSPLSKNSYLHNLNFEDRKSSSLVITPIFDLKMDLYRPVQKTKSVGWYPSFWADDHSIVGRDQLTSKISINMNIKIYEPLTEKILFETEQEYINSSKINYFVDAGWKKIQLDSTSQFLKYDGIYCSNYQNFYLNFLTENYSKLLNKIHSSINSHLLADLISQSNLIREQIIPKVSDIDFTFGFKYPTKYNKSVNVSAAFLSERQETEEVQSSVDKTTEIYSNFKNSLAKQIDELFNERGIKIFGKYKSIDDMVYMEKKEAYFVLSLDKDYSLNRQNFKSEEMGPIRIETSDVNFKGDFTLTMIEPMSKQKLYKKKINVEDTIKNTKKVIYSRNDENIVIADTNPEIVSKLLDKAYQNIMQELWDLLSPNYLSKIKSNVNEIRERLGFPVLP